MNNIFLLDIGNSQIKIIKISLSELPHQQSLPDNAVITYFNTDQVILKTTPFHDYLTTNCKKDDFVVYCSVVPNATEILNKIIKPLQVKSFDIKIFLTNFKINKNLLAAALPEIGGDILAYLFFITQMCQGNGLLFVSGTTNLLIAVKNYEFVDMQIAPGTQLQITSLIEHCALIDVAKWTNDSWKNVSESLKLDTTKAVYNGCFFTTVAWINNNLEKYNFAIDQIYLTGNFSHYLLPHLKVKVHYNKHLLFNSLFLIAKKFLLL